MFFMGENMGKNTMGTFLRHLEQAFWYLALHWLSHVLQIRQWRPSFF